MEAALMGTQVCSETIVIRSNDDWRRAVRSLQYDGQRYTPATPARVASGSLQGDTVAQLDAWLGQR
jgi:hypothetical protein